MTVVTAAATLKPTCEARTGFAAGDWSETPLWCNATVGVTTWTDSRGTQHHACRHHVEAIQRRYPVRYVSEIADDPLGQAKAAREMLEAGTATFERSGLRVVDQHGETCWRAGHVPGCPGMAGGDHELRDGWVSLEIDGQTVEVEVA